MTWEQEARRILRAEMTRAGVGYKTLAIRLSALGIDETSVNLSNKVARGKFSFAFFLQVMKALGIVNVNVDARVSQPALERKSKGADSASKDKVGKSAGNANSS